LVAYGAMMLLSYFLGRKFYKIPYQISRMFSYLLMALGLSMLTWYLFPDNYPLKFVAILVYLAFVIALEKDNVYQTLKRF